MPDDIAYVLWREGRPRTIFSDTERALGFKGQDLKHPPTVRDGSEKDGAWFSLAETRLFARELVAAIAKAKRDTRARAVPVNTPQPLPTPQPETATRRTVAALLDDFLRAMRAGEPGPNGSPLSDNSIRSYEKAAAALRYKPETDEAARSRRAAEREGETPPRAKETFGQAPLAAIGAPELNDFFGYLKRVRGLYMARAAMATLSAAWTWGTASKHWRLGPNPRLTLSFEKPEGRIVIVERAAFDAFVAAADALGVPSIGDSWYLGIFTAQRQNDRLALADRKLDDGRRVVRQSKGGRVVSIKEAPTLKVRLDDARRRAAATALRLGLREEARAKTIVVCEATGRAYAQDHYRHVVADVRAAAVAGIVRIDGRAVVASGGDFKYIRAETLGFVPVDGANLDWIVRPCPELAGKRDQDLRDTGITMLYRAGNDIPAIMDISGHSYAAVQTIIEHYLGRDVRRADRAIDLLEAYWSEEGGAG